MPKQHKDQPLPWKLMFLVVGAFFITGLLFIMQEFSAYFQGSIVGKPAYLLQGYDCPNSSYTYEVSPVPDLLSYTKGNIEANRKEVLRINKKNHGLTAWFSYDRGFNESAKTRLIDLISYETNPTSYAVRLYNEIIGDASPHGSVDLVTKWLSPDNHNLPTVFPYSSGLVIDAVTGSSGGYGNYVSVCTDVSLPGGDQMRILYSIAHLKDVNVVENQTVYAGTQLGTIGNTGRSTTPHAHIAIQPDMVWIPDYKSAYNAGYKFYFAVDVPEIMVKTIDPLAVFLNPGIAYSIVQNDQMRQGIFNNAAGYIAQLSGGVATTGDVVTLTSGSSSPVFDSFRITTAADEVKKGESIHVTVEALDQNGQVYADFAENIDVVLSSSTATFFGVTQMQSGKASFQVTDSRPGEVVIQVGNGGSVVMEKKVVFADRLEYLELTTPQKTSVGRNVAVVVRPVGTLGGAITDQISATVDMFPALVPQQVVTTTNGRGEYQFQALQEGIYQLTFAVNGIKEQVQITVTAAAEQPVEEVVEEATEEPAEENVAEQPETSETPTEETPSEESGAAETAPAAAEEVVTILESDQFRSYVDGESQLIVFNDANVESEYPVEVKFTVPAETQTVSIFTGLNDRNFPDSGELKLSKYTPGQETVRYFPKYVQEDSYKKIVAYGPAGEVLHEQVFTWSPASQHVFTDVVDGVTDPEIFEAVGLLKEAGVVKGNPDGSYGVETPINRAATATILIRAFYSDIDLNTLDVGQLDFTDVPPAAWYASAIWFASQEEYLGESKPVIIKGFEGRANPDGNVKLEEMVTMILRILEVEVAPSEPWYESYISTAIQLGLITEAERSYIDQPLTRGLVARMMVKALELAQDMPEIVAPVADEAVEDDATGGPEEASAELTPSARDIQFELTTEKQLKLSWKSEFDGPFKVFRETLGGAGEIQLGSTKGPGFTDTSAQVGKTYTYRIAVDQPDSERAELLVEL